MACHECRSNWFLEHDKYPNSPQISMQEHIWKGRFVSWMCSQQIHSNYMMLTYENRPKSLRNDSSKLLNLCKKRVCPNTSKMHLMNWSVSAACDHGSHTYMLFKTSVCEGQPVTENQTEIKGGLKRSRAKPACFKQSRCAPIAQYKINKDFLNSESNKSILVESSIEIIEVQLKGRSPLTVYNFIF